jgi:hypothetical protein
MKCPIESRDTEILLAYSAGKVGVESAPMVASHLEGCAACKQFVRSQSAVWDALEVWQARPVSADFNRRLYARIEKPSGWFDRLMQPLHSMGLRIAVPVAASAAVVLMAGMLMQRSSTPPAVQHDTALIESIQPDQVEEAIAEMEALSQLSRPARADSSDSKM